MEVKLFCVIIACKKLIIQPNSTKDDYESFLSAALFIVHRGFSESAAGISLNELIYREFATMPIIYYNYKPFSFCSVIEANLFLYCLSATISILVQILLSSPGYLHYFFYSYYAYVYLHFNQSSFLSFLFSLFFFFSTLHSENISQLE